MEELTELQEKSVFIKRLATRADTRIGFQKKALERNIAIATSILEYAKKKAGEQHAIGNIAIDLGVGDARTVENIIESLILSGEIKREGDKLVYITP